FSQQIFQNHVVQHRIRQQAFQLRVLVLELLQPLCVRQVHPAILGLQLVEGRGAQPVLPAKLGGRQTRLMFLDHPDDLRLGKTAFPHLVCSFSGWADSTSQRGNFRGAGQLPKDTGERAVVSDNILDRAFEASAPNQKWIADFTYIWTAEGWLYVAAVVDLFSRRVVGWAMKAEMTAQLVTDALIMAIWRRGKPDS